MMDDIYGDLENFGLGDTVKELQDENEKLTLHINELTSTLEQTMKDLENIKKSNTILQQNLSKLFNTAKADYDRRTRIINELQQKLDDLIFKRNQGQNYRIPKRKPDMQQELGEPETKKRKFAEVDTKTNENKQFSNDRKNSGALKDLYKNDSVKRDRSVKARDNRHNYRRSRSRSRERRRKSPPRDMYRSNRDYDRNKSRHYSPDLRPKNIDPEPEPCFEVEQKQLLEIITQNKIERSDSDSIVSIHSTSSLDETKPEVISKKREKTKSKSKEKTHSKNKKSDKTCDKSKSVELKISKTTNDIKLIIKTKTDEVEEGEISDDDCEISKEKMPQCREEKQDKSSTIVKVKKEHADKKSSRDKVPIKKCPISKDPIEKGPVEKVKIEKGSIDKVPIEKGPIDKHPIEKGPTEKVKIEKCSIDKVPIEKGPIDKSPIEKGPTEKVKIEKCSIDKVPIEKGPIDKGPIEKGPVDRVLIEKGLLDKIPVEKGPIDKVAIEKDPLEMDIKIENWQNTSTNEEASISFLLQKSEAIKKVINEIDENNTKSTSITKLTGIKTETFCDDNKTPVISESEIKCETTKHVTPVVTCNIDTVKGTSESIEASKENVSNNQELDTKPKKPKRRRCVMLN